jgi:hypothetical protein
MRYGFHALTLVAIVATTSPALAQGRPKADPDWPCFQIKVPTFSLNSVWTGPEIDPTSDAWRSDAGVADLVAKMAQRRVPIAEAEAAIANFAGKAGPDAKARLLLALGGAFQELTHQRAQVIDGLERFGKKQNEMAERIRAENEALQSAPADKPDAPNSQGVSNQEQLQWDLRVFDDRHRTISYVCDTPTLIEQRIGSLARAVQKAL